MDIGSILGTVASGAAGGLLRLAPEAIKLLDRRNERKHELALQDKQLTLLQVQGDTRIEEAQVQADISQIASQLDAIKAIAVAQAQPTGVKWIDGLNASVRPVWTYYVLLTWGAVKVTDVWVALSRNLDWEMVRPRVWGPEDAAMVAGLSTFWFLDRVIRRQQDS